MSAKTTALAETAIAAFSAFVYGLIAEQNEKLYRPNWAEEYGEAISKRQACELLNRSFTYLDKLVTTRQIKVSADGRVLTRSLQEFAETSPEHKRHVRRCKRKEAI